MEIESLIERADAADAASERDGAEQFTLTKLIRRDWHTHSASWLLQSPAGEQMLLQRNMICYERDGSYLCRYYWRAHPYGEVTRWSEGWRGSGLSREFFPRRIDLISALRGAWEAQSLAPTQAA